MSTIVPEQTGLSTHQLAQYERDGYLIVPNLITDDDIQTFLDAFTNEKGATYALMGHKKDPQWRALACHPRVVGMAEQMLGGPAQIVQTMYLNKKAAGGQGIALHQDVHYLVSEPDTLMACWIAFTDSGPENGGLCVVPGSHRKGLRATHRTANEKDHISWSADYDMRDRDGREWKHPMHSFEIDDLDPSSIARLNVPKGAGVFFTGLTIHGSFANESPDKPRRAFATHYVREGSWLFRKDVQETVPAR